MDQDRFEVHAELRIGGEVTSLRRMRRVGNWVTMDGTGFPTEADVQRAMEMLADGPDEHLTPDELSQLLADMREFGG